MRSQHYYRILLLPLFIGLLELGSAHAEDKPELDLKFPGEAPAHRVVYQLNKADPVYQEHILFSVGAMVRKYGDNIKVVVVAIGPGIHTLAKKPKRPVSEEIKQRIRSLNEYGVEFHACGNTMKTQGWKDEDMLSLAKVVEVGASDLMELQEQGYSYISW
ncbi:MAG: DsrE family protein [Gammaproteobacteria bacterium]|nr:DsrE family protein [Gammaproteobacteria bacterium]